MPSQAASRLLATPSTTLATSDKRSAEPFCDLMTSPAYSLALVICPFTAMSRARVGLSKLPVDSVTLALRMAVYTSCADRLAARSAPGFSRTRTAGFSAPLICTWLTPSNCDRRCPRMVSAAS